MKEADQKEENLEFVVRAEMPGLWMSKVYNALADKCTYQAPEEDWHVMRASEVECTFPGIRIGDKLYSLKFRATVNYPKALDYIEESRPDFVLIETDSDFGDGGLRESMAERGIKTASTDSGDADLDILYGLYGRYSAEYNDYKKSQGGSTAHLDHRDELRHLSESEIKSLGRPQLIEPDEEI